MGDLLGLEFVFDLVFLCGFYFFLNWGHDFLFIGLINDRFGFKKLDFVEMSSVFGV